MTILLENDTHRIDCECGCDYNYIVWFKAQGFLQEVARSWTLSKKVTKHFTEQEVQKIRSNLHALKFVNAKYK